MKNIGQKEKIFFTYSILADRYFHIIKDKKGTLKYVDPYGNEFYFNISDIIEYSVLK